MEKSLLRSAQLGIPQKFVVYRSGLVDIRAAAQADVHRCDPLIRTEEQVLEEISGVFPVQKVEKIIEN